MALLKIPNCSTLIVLLLMSWHMSADAMPTARINGNVIGTIDEVTESVMNSTTSFFEAILEPAVDVSDRRSCANGSRVSSAVYLPRFCIAFIISSLETAPSPSLSFFIIMPRN